MNSLSIIIPIYNSEKYLERCLDSVRALVYPIEVVLIDDGSTDDSGKICDQYAASDERFTVIHQINKGLVEARKRGIEEVNNRYFAFLDSDDYIDSVEYDEMLEEIFNKDLVDVDIICTGMTEEYIGRRYKKINKFPDGVYASHKLEKLCRNMLSKGDFFDFGILPNAVCKIYSVDFVKANKISVSAAVKIGEDADMTYQLMVKAQKVLVFNKTPYHYCRRDNSMMWEKVSQEALDSLECDLKSAFVSSEYDKDMLISQLKDYMDFIYLLCDPNRVLKDTKFFDSKTDRIALYGAGGVGKAVKYELDNCFPLWVDQNFDIYNDNDVEPVEKMIEEKDSYDKVFIALSNISICEKIRQSLIAMGVDKPIYYFRCENNE